MARLYSYVGPENIAKAVDMTAPRAQITSPEDIRRWIVDSPPELDGTGAFTVSFVIDAAGRLWIADRRSEHVACARGGRVLSAGEMTFAVTNQGVEATYATNQSTGYCPEPESWPHVAATLDKAGIDRPQAFDVCCEFRRCTCGQINIVKNNDFECAVCGIALSRQWNLDADK